MGGKKKQRGVLERGRKEHQEPNSYYLEGECKEKNRDFKVSKRLCAKAFGSEV